MVSSSNHSPSSPLLRISPTPTAETYLTQNSHHHHHQPNIILRIHNFIFSQIRRYLSSPAQHYTILLLVSLDVLAIFADIIINLYQCDFPKASPRWEDVRNGLSIASLVFSCLFMLEVLLNLWVFGLRFLSTSFHILDTLVIIASFTIDVLLHGTIEEIASLVVILRLWRVFKIIEEFSVGAQEERETLQLRIHHLELENGELKREFSSLHRSESPHRSGSRHKKDGSRGRRGRYDGEDEGGDEMV